MQDTHPCPLLLTAGPPPSRQQIAHGLGHPTEPGLTEPPWVLSRQLGLDSGCAPTQAKTSGYVLANTVIYQGGIGLQEAKYC